MISRESALRRLKRPESLLVFILILIPFCFQHWFTAELVGRHAWAQADHFSIAQQFGEHPNFFVPHSHNLAPDFMGEERSAVDSGITRADFPLPHWIAGQVMQWTPSHKLCVTRLIFYFFSALGVWFFARAIAEESQKPRAAALLTVAIFGGPLWLFYSSANMPSTVSLAALLASLWSFGRLRRSGRDSDFMLTLLLLALAALMRPPAAVFGLAFGLLALETGILRGIRRWLFSVAILGCCSVYAWHSVSLGREFGSLFLSSVDWGLNPWELIQAWSTGVSLHLSQSGPFLLAALLGLILAVTQRQWGGPVIRAGLLATVLIFTYQVMAAPQFQHHDYYLLDTLVPLSLVLLYFATSAWKGKAWVLIASAAVLSGLAWSNKGELYRREPVLANDFDRVQLAFVASKGFLDDAGVQTNERVLVLDSRSTNLPLIYLEREGYLVDFPNAAKLKTALTYPWDAVVIPRASLDQPWVEEAQLPSRLFCVASNGLLGVYRPLAASESRQDPEEFRGDFALRCEHAFLESLEGKDEFPGGVSVSIPAGTNTTSGFQVRFGGVQREANGHALLVVSAGDGYVQRHLPPGERAAVELIMPYDPAITKVNAYIWNLGERKIRVDSLEVSCCIGHPTRP